MDASRAAKLDEGDFYIAGGVESMTRAPYVLSKNQSAFGRDAQMFDTTIGWRFVNPKLAQMFYPYSMGETAENVARKWKVSREKQDEFAYNSQLKYKNAHKAGRFKDEIIPVEVPQKKTDPILFNTDEHPRFSSLEVLGQLKPAFMDNGTVTAGNSSGINDGAAACLIASEDAVKKFKLEPIARVVAMAVTGVEPDLMGVGPVPATKKALKRAGLKIGDLDLIELNEAFASQSLACIKDLDLDPGKVNVNGGAIALGHPLGASGTRISTTLLHEMMKRDDTKMGLATMCIGVGQGAAIIFEKC